jgi:hypothetical protein
MLTEDCRCHTDIKRRIAMAKEALTKKGELMRGTLSLDLKKRIIKTLIWSVVLYGFETWTLVKADIKRLEACEMWIWSKIMKISWTEHKTNDDVLKIVQEERTMIDTIRRRQKNWIGHILRGNSLLKTVLEGRMQGKKTQGRPRTMLLDWMKSKELSRGFKEVKEMAQDRSEWRCWNFEPA